MVMDKLENASIYYGLGKNFQTALEWLQNVNPNELTPGETVEIDGDQVFATLFCVDTLPEDACKLEGHHNYADLQYVVEGTEGAGYLLEGPEEPLGPYEPDIQFFRGPWDRLTVRAGMFYIVWPQDLHAPRMAIGQPTPVTRLVVKIKL